MSLFATVVTSVGGGNNTAIIDLTHETEDKPQEWSTHDIAHGVFKVAKLLYLRSIRKGSIVATSFTNNIEFLITLLACAHLGAAVIPLNPAYTAKECKFYMEDASVNLLVTLTNNNSVAQEVASQLNIKILQFNANHKKINSALQNESIDLPENNLSQPDDIALILYTSGTTGNPKAVPLTQANLIASINNIKDTYNFTSDDIGYLVMPLFHVHGLMCGTLAPLASKSVVVIPGPFSASKFWKHLQEWKVTWYTAVPTIHQILLKRHSDDYPKHDPPKLRFIRSCSSALPPALLPEMEKKFNAPVLEAYAMTEASHQMTSNPLPCRGPHIPGSVGYAQGTVRVTIRNPVTGEELPLGETGEVCVCGPNVMNGYLHNPEANGKAFFEKVWFRTGDLGYLKEVDKHNYLYLSGRIKEMINRGGEKISPIEIDNFFLTNPKVKECVSFGIPDAKYGEVVGIAIVVKDGETCDESELVTFAQSGLAGFKIPSKWFFAQDLPKTSTGKVQRRLVAAKFLENATDRSQN